MTYRDILYLKLILLHPLNFNFALKLTIFAPGAKECGPFFYPDFIRAERYFSNVIFEREQDTYVSMYQSQIREWKSLALPVKEQNKE